MGETAAIAAAQDASDKEIPGGPVLPKSVQTALEYLAHQAAKECKLKNGPTCLYWALRYTLVGQIDGGQG